MTNLEDAYLRANIHLADTLAEALISVNEEETGPRNIGIQTARGTNAPVKARGKKPKRAETDAETRKRIKAQGGQVAVAEESEDSKPGSSDELLQKGKAFVKKYRSQKTKDAANRQAAREAERARTMNKSQDPS